MTQKKERNSMTNNATIGQNIANIAILYQENSYCFSLKLTTDNCQMIHSIFVKI